MNELKAGTGPLVDRLLGKAPLPAPAAPSLSLQEALQAVLDKVKAQRAVVLVPKDNDMEAVASIGMDRTTAWQHLPQAIIRRVLAEKQRLLTHNAMQDPRAAEVTSVIVGGLRSVMCFPLRGGVLYLDNPITHGAFQARQLDELEPDATRLGDLI